MAGCRSGDEFLALPCEWLPKPRRESRSLTIVSSGTYPRLALALNSQLRLHSRTGSSWHLKRRERSAFAGSLGARTLKSGLSFKECRSVTRPEPDRRASEIRFGSQADTVAIFLMKALKCDDLRRRVRHLKVRFHHSHGAKCERAAKNNECDIPGHRRTPHFP
jgi:hypothetical protein